MISEAQGNSPRPRGPRYTSPAQAVSSLRVLREPAGIERTITEILMDVRLPEVLLEWITPLLAARNCTVAPSTVRDPYDGKIERHVSIVERDGGRVYLLFIPQHVLNAPSSDALSGVSYFEDMFREESAQLLLLSESIDALHAAFVRMLRTWDRANTVKARFIPWRRLTDIWDTPDADDLMFALELEDLLPQPLGNVLSLAGGGTRPPDDNLTEQEKRVIATALANLARAEFTGPSTYFNRFIGELDLPAEIRDQARVSGEDPAGDAKKLVDWTDAHGQYPHEHRYKGSHLSGVLILNMAKEAGVGRPRDLVTNIARQRGLLSDELMAELPPPSVTPPAER
jgi:hypothetical protein